MNNKSEKFSVVTGNIFMYVIYDRYLHGLDKIIGKLPFLVLYLKRPTRAAPIVGGHAVFFEF